MKDKLGYVDNFFSDRGYNILKTYAESAKYEYGKRDYDYSTPPTGVVHTVDREGDIWDMLVWRIEEVFPFVNEWKIYDITLNCFAPGEVPYFHPDVDEKGGVTFIYYVNPWKMNDGGETQIMVGDEIRSYPPLPNRMIWFDGSLWHRATSRRDDHRFTYAIKYSKHGWSM